MTILEAKNSLVLFFKSLGMTKEEASSEYLNLNKNYKDETLMIIKEALIEYINN